MSKQSLTSKTANGVVWNSIDRIINYGLSFFIGIILARLLSPDEYGLIGIIGIFIAIFNVILDSGLSTALIRKKNTTDVDYCTVFYSNIVLSIILTSVLYICAPLISNFFSRPELTPYTRVMSFILVINALSITQQVRLTKNIDFKTQTKISLISHTLSGLTGILLAFWGFGVWALIVQQLTSRVLISLLLWFYNKWFPGFIFSISSFKELFRFSWKLLVAQIVNTTWNQFTQIVIGKFHSAYTLGQFTRAQQYTALCSSTIGDVVLKVSLPVMSEIQDDDTRLLRGFRTIIKSSVLVSAPLLIGMAASAQSLICVLIGAKWLDCVPMMQLLCFSYMIYPLHQVNINMLIVQGRSDLQLIMQIIKCILAIVPIVIGIIYDIYWMLLGYVITDWIALFINSYYSGKKFNYSCWNQLGDVLPSLIAAIIMGIPVFFISYIPLSPFVLLPLQILVGAAIIFSVYEISKNKEYLMLKNLFLEKIKKI